MPSQKETSPPAEGASVVVHGKKEAYTTKAHTAETDMCTTEHVFKLRKNVVRPTFSPYLSSAINYCIFDDQLSPDTLQLYIYIY